MVKPETPPWPTTRRASADVVAAPGDAATLLMALDGAGLGERVLAALHKQGYRVERN